MLDTPLLLANKTLDETLRFNLLLPLDKLEVFALPANMICERSSLFVCRR